MPKDIRQFDRAGYEVLPLALVGLGVAAYEVILKPELTKDRLAFIGGLVLGATFVGILRH